MESARSVHPAQFDEAHKEGPVANHRASSLGRNRQLTRFQVWPPQNMPPKAQPWTLSVLELFSAIVES
jgi:hypothetical protein